MKEAKELIRRFKNYSSNLIGSRIPPDQAIESAIIHCDILSERGFNMEEVKQCLVKELEKYKPGKKL